MQGRKRMGALPVVMVLVLFILVMVAVSTSMVAYASDDYVVDRIPIESVEIVSFDGRLLKENSTIRLGVNLNPEYAIDTINDIKYDIIWGKQLVDINENKIIPKSENVGGEVQVVATVDGILSTNVLHITVEKDDNIDFVPVEKVVIDQQIDHRRTSENSSYYHDELFYATIIPANATQQYIDRVEILDGRDLVSVVGEQIFIKDNIPAGDLTFSLRVWAYGQASNILEYSIYVPVKGIKFELTNQAMYSPLSKISSSDTVSFYASVTNQNATDKTIKVYIDKGYELVSSLDYNQNNKYELRNNKLSIEQALTYKLNKDSNRAINLKAVAADGVVSYINNIEVQVPAESVKLRLVGNLYRGDYTHFEPIYNGDIDAYISDNPEINASVSRILSGGDISISGDDVVIDMDAMTIQVPRNTSGYTQIDVDSWIYSNEVETATFVVEGLQDITVGASFLDSSGFNAGFLIQYGSDSSNVRIAKDKRQLHTGRSTDITVLYNNQSLSTYGLTLEKVELIDLNTMSTTSKASAIIDNNKGTIKLTINSTAAGSDTIGLKIYVRDGGISDIKLFDDTTNDTLKGTVQDINVFVPMSGSFYLQSGMLIINKETKITPGMSNGWNFGATYTMDDLVLNTLQTSPTGISILEGNILRIENSSAAEKQYIFWSYDQPYNDVTIRYESRDYLEPESIPLRTATLDNMGGGGPSKILFINGLDAKINTSKTNYALRGYYLENGGNGTQYFDKDGKQTSAISYSASVTLYASWVNTFNHVEFRADGTQESHSESGQVQVWDTFHETGLQLSRLKANGYNIISFYVKIDHRNDKKGRDKGKLFNLMVATSKGVNEYYMLRDTAGNRLDKWVESNLEWEETHFEVSMDINTMISKFGDSPQITLFYGSDNKNASFLLGWTYVEITAITI